MPSMQNPSAHVHCYGKIHNGHAVSNMHFFLCVCFEYGFDCADLHSQGQHIAKDNVVACPACDFLCFKPQMTK